MKKMSNCWCSVTNLCLSFSYPMDSSPPGSTVHGIFQTRIVTCAAIYFIPSRLPAARIISFDAHMVLSVCTRFDGRTDVEAPILWTPDVKSQLIGKGTDDGKDCGQERRGIREWDGSWYHRLNGHEFEQTQGDYEGQEAWHAAVNVVAKSWIGLSDWTRKILNTYTGE